MYRRFAKKVTSIDGNMELSAGRPCSEWHAAWKAECERLQQDIGRLRLQKSSVANAIEMIQQKETPPLAQNSPTRSILADKSTNTASKRRPKKVTPRIEVTKNSRLQPDFDKIPRSQRLPKGAPPRKTKATEQVPQATTPTHQLSPWEICYQVNLAFQKKITGPWQCVVCNRTGYAATPEYRSNFVMVVATCPDGHKDHLSSSSDSGTTIACKRCDEDFALKLSQQTVKCFHPACRRILVVDWELVRWAHAGEEWQDILKQYLELLQKNPKFYCVICQETLPTAESPGRTPTRKCKHQVNACSDCLSGMLKFAVDTGNFKEIKCPAAATDKCKRVLHGKDVEALADRETYKKYDKFMMEELLRSDPTYRWCTNKTKDGICTWGQLHPLGDTAPRWECTKCNASNCFTCKTLWHHGLTCRQLELRRENDPASLKLLQETTKKCPGCGHRIEKDRFCKDMICQKAVGGCGIEFCWACKIIYKPQKQHLGSCPQKPYGATIASRPKMPSTVYREDWDKDPGYIAPPNEYDMTGYGVR